MQLKRMYIMHAACKICCNVHAAFGVLLYDARCLPLWCCCCTFRQCLELLNAISLCGPPAGMTATRPSSSACKPVAFSTVGPADTARRSASGGAQLAHRLCTSKAIARLLRIVAIACLRDHQPRRARLLYSLSGVQAALPGIAGC